MKISTERLKQIIKEELEAHALLEQPGDPDTPAGNPDNPKFDAEEQEIVGSDEPLPKTWRQQVRLAKTKKRVIIRKNQGYWHLTYLLKAAFPYMSLSHKSRKTRKLVRRATMAMQGGSSTLVVGKNYADVHLKNFLGQASTGKSKPADKPKPKDNTVLTDPRNFDRKDSKNAYKLYVKAAKNRIKYGYPGWIPLTESMFVNPNHKYFGLTTFEMNRVNKTRIKGRISPNVPKRDDPKRDYVWWNIFNYKSEQKGKMFVRAWLSKYAKLTGIPVPFDHGDPEKAKPRSQQNPEAGALADTIQAALDKRPKGSPASRWTLVPDILRKYAKGTPLKTNEIKVLQGLAGQSGVNKDIKAGLDKVIGEFF